MAFRFSEDYGRNLEEGWIITLDESGSEKIDHRVVRYAPVWQWLLAGAK